MSLPDYLSYSSFTTYLECSEKFRLTRVERIQEDPAWWFIGGTAVHTALDTYDRTLMAGAADDVPPF